MNEKYWPKYYAEKDTDFPSDFALFCFSYIKPGSKILDVGAGDGRDSWLLAKKGHVVAIEPNTDKPGKIPGVHQCKCTLKDFFDKPAKVDNRLEAPDVIYARWFLHTVPEEDTRILFEFARIEQADLMLEFRAEGDKVEDDTHERRLINPYELVERLVKNGYVIKHFEVGNGLSKRGEDDPYLGRVIAEYKRR